MTHVTRQLGRFELTIVSGGTLRIDGGSMFGIIPKAMWERECPADDHNRILLDTNCLLVRTPDSLGLIDTGYGNKAPEKIRRRSDLAPDHTLLRNLNTLGIAAADIEWVILTHLHFDHAGGSTLRDDDGTLRPTFPRAAHFVQSAEYEDAAVMSPDLAGAYSPEDFLPLDDAKLLQQIADEHEIVPGVTTRLTPGHTRGHQSVLLSSEGESAIYLGDLAPMLAHLRVLWSMAYDQFPITMRQVKRDVFRDIADHDRTAILCHDPTVRMTRLRLDARGDAEAVDA